MFHYYFNALRRTTVGPTISLVGIGIYRPANNKLSTDTILPTLALLIFRVSFQCYLVNSRRAVTSGRGWERVKGSRHLQYQQLIDDTC